MSNQSFRRCDHARQWAWAVRLLADRRWHSMAELARASSIPVRCWRPALEAFARMGAPLQFDTARGGRALRELSPLPASGLLRRGVRLPMPVETHFLLDSTNSHLLRALGAGDVRLRACVAEQQSQGHGRRGRAWLTPLGGGLALSVAVPMGRLRDRRALPLRVGVGVAEALSRLGLRQVGIKWPNDLVVHGRKLGGLLIEGGSAGFVIGVGLNHHGFVSAGSRVDPGIGQPFTSLMDELGVRAPSRERVAVVMLEAIEAMLRGTQDDWAERFARYDALCDRPVRVVGETAWHGIARGITADGALRVETIDGERLCHAGEVSIRMRAHEQDGRA